MKKLTKHAAHLFAASVLALGGCGGITLLKAAPQADVYDLSTNPQFAALLRASNGSW